jgi:RNA polymerase sigma-70 factor (ECF subfamily)
MAVEHSLAISVGVDLHGMNLELISTSAEAVELETDGGLRINESAFRALYEQTATPLLRYLIGMTRTPDIAEDLLQETYCRFLTARLPDMDDRQTRNYLFRIAINLIRDRWRRSKDEPPPPDPDEIRVPTSHLDRRLGVRQAFDRLKPRERQLLWLAYVEGSNHQEIAEHTGLQPGSIRLLLFRARRKLADLIGTKSPAREVSK